MHHRKQGDSVQIGALEARWYIETAIPGFGGQAAYRSVLFEVLRLAYPL